MDSSKVTKQIKLNGNIRDAAWMTRQFQKGRIRFDNSNGNGITDVLNETLFNQFKTAIRVVNEVYEEAWDIDFYIHINTYSRKTFIMIRGIYILFPQITIRNRDNKTHLIKDLLVRITLFNQDNSNIRVGRLMGGRLTLSYAEYQSDYFHSHLPSYGGNINPRMTLPFLNSFCTGSGEINIFQSNINGDGFSEERFMRYVMQLMSLVGYESIEGTPYRHISKISVRFQSGSVFHLDNRKKERFKSRIIRYYKDNNIIPTVDITIDSTNQYFIADNEAFQNFIYNTEFSEEEKHQYFCTLSDNGTYYTFGSTPEFSPAPVVTSTFIFRSEEKNMTIEPAPVTATTVTYIVHPNLIKHLKEEIEYELNQDKIRQSTINRYKIELDNAREGVQSDPIPVSADS